MDFYSSLCPPLAVLFLFSFTNISSFTLSFLCLPPSPAAQVRLPSRQRSILRQLCDHSCSARHGHGADAPGVTLHILYPPLLFQIRATESPYQKGKGQSFSEHSLLGGKRRGLLGALGATMKGCDHE